MHSVGVLIVKINASYIDIRNYAYKNFVYK